MLKKVRDILAILASMATIIMCVATFTHNTPSRAYKSSLVNESTQSMDSIPYLAKNVDNNTRYSFQSDSIALIPLSRKDMLNLVEQIRLENQSLRLNKDLSRSRIRSTRLANKAKIHAIKDEWSSNMYYSLLDGGTFFQKCVYIYQILPLVLRIICGFSFLILILFIGNCISCMVKATWSGPQRLIDEIGEDVLVLIYPLLGVAIILGAYLMKF